MKGFRFFGFLLAAALVAPAGAAPSADAVEDQIVTAIEEELLGFDLAALIPAPIAADIESGTLGTYDLYLQNPAWSAPAVSAVPVSGGYAVTVARTAFETDLWYDRTCIWTAANPFDCLGPETIAGGLSIASVVFSVDLTDDGSALNIDGSSLLVMLVDVEVDIDPSYQYLGEVAVDVTVDFFNNDYEGDMADVVNTAIAGISTAPPPDLQVGIDQGEDLGTWQPGDSATASGGGQWYCNASVAASGHGVITDWQLVVFSGGLSGETVQLAVIRCAAGSGGTGPELTGCEHVGLGPLQTVSGDGLNSYSLAGSNQLDGVSADPDGIVVQPGDFICADSDAFEIGVDCEGSSASGGCPGPDFDTQVSVDLDLAPAPFDLADSSSDGTLMIRAWGEASGLIFSDGFETGDVCSWSDSEPAGACSK